jgi:hypothetical protein
VICHYTSAPDILAFSYAYSKSLQSGIVSELFSINLVCQIIDHTTIHASAEQTTCVNCEDHPISETPLDDVSNIFNHLVEITVQILCWGLGQLCKSDQVATAVQVMSWWKFIDVIRHRDQTFKLCSQIQGIAFTTVKERFNAQQVSSCKYVLTIGNHEGKNSVVQMLENVTVVLLVQMKKQALFLKWSIRDPKGSGKLLEIAHLAVVTNSQSSIFDRDISPVGDCHGAVSPQIILGHRHTFAIPDS